MSNRHPLPARTLPDEGKSEKQPIVRRADIVAFSLSALLLICIVAVLYVGRAFFLPTITAFVIGTMLAPAAKFFERYRIPRSLSAILIVSTTFAAIVFLIALISAPLIEWTTRLPEIIPQLKDKFHIFDRPMAFWRQLQNMFDVTPSAETSLQFPKIEWVQPTLEFLSPTFTEILLFLVILILFIMGWPDLRRTLVFTFASREARLRTLRILNEIETSLGGYLLTVTLINLGVGILTGLICFFSHMPNSPGLGALAMALNFIPIIGPVAMFVILLAVSLITSSSFLAGLIAPLCFAVVAFIEGHFLTPTIIGKKLALNALAIFLALAFWTWLWGPMGAFLSSPLLIVGLVLKEHLVPDNDPQMPEP